MRALFGNAVATATEMQGQFVQGRDTVVPPPNWVWFARRCWPEKTAAHLASIGGYDERTAKRWLAGEYDPPNAVMAVIIAKLFERG